MGQEMWHPAHEPDPHGQGPETRECRQAAGDAEPGQGTRELESDERPRPEADKRSSPGQQRREEPSRHHQQMR